MLFKAYNLIVESDFDLKLPIAYGKPDLYISYNSILLPPLEPTRIYRKDTNAYFGGSFSDSYLHWKDIANFRSLEGHTLYYQQLTPNMELFRIFLLSEAIGLILLQKGLFLLHASAVTINQKAIIFAGIPGAGKSTTTAAFAREGFPILSDDLTAIQFDNHHKPFVVPAFPEIKIWKDTAQQLAFDIETLTPAYEGHQKYIYKQPTHLFPIEPIPLEQIVVLRSKYSRNNRSVLPTNMLVELLAHFPLPTQLLKPNYLKQHFKDSIHIVQQVQINSLKRPKNFEELQNFVKSKKQPL